MAKPPATMTETERRNARLAEALRTNLMRRKARARAVDAPAKADDED